MAHHLQCIIGLRQGLDAGDVPVLGRERLLARMSRSAVVAYVETDYFGGAGTQAAAVWRDGVLAWGPEKASPGPINGALRLLGARAREGTDEFESVGLHRFRSNEDWLDGGEATRAASA